MSTQRHLGTASSDSLSLAQGAGLASLLAALFLRAGRVNCYHCGLVFDDGALVREALSRLQSARLRGPISLRASLTETGDTLRERLSEMKAEGWRVLWLDGEAIALSEVSGTVLGESIAVEIASWETPSADSDVDRGALHEACRIGRGCLSLHGHGREVEVLGSKDCRQCGQQRPVVGTALLRLGSAEARCGTCAGLGREMQIDRNLLVRDPTLALSEGAITPWQEKNAAFFGGLLQELCGRVGILMQPAWSELSVSARELLLLGDPESDFRGVVHDMERRLEAVLLADGPDRDWVFSYCSSHACEGCGGSGWSEQSESVRLGDLSIAQVYAATLQELPALLAGAKEHMPDTIDVTTIADKISRRLSRMQPIFHLRLGARRSDLSEAEKNWLSGYVREHQAS